LGKGGATWEHAQGVDSSTLDNMGASKRLNDLIDTSTRSHNDRHKKIAQGKWHMTKDGVHRSKRPMIDGQVGLDAHTRSKKGCDIRLSVDLQRGITNQRYVMFHTSDSWIPYKIKGTQPKEDIENFGKRFGEQV
jgi:hypothetical protein